MIGLVMSAGFAIEVLFLEDWPWWAWGICASVCLIGLVLEDTWPWWEEKRNRSWRDAHTEAIRILNLKVWTDRAFLIALLYVMIGAALFWIVGTRVLEWFL